MAVKSEAVTVTTSAVLIASGRSISDTKQVVVQPSGDVYVGGSDVSTSNGVLVGSGDSLALFLGVGDELYAVSGGSVSIRVLQTRD
jgi:hypothetical protein